VPVPQDQQLVAETLRGNRDAFGSLVAKYRDQVFGFLLRMTGDRDLAGDLAQDSFIRAFTRLDTYDPSRPFRPWLFAIAHNACTDVMRRRRGESSLDDEGAPELPAGEEASPELAAERTDLQRAVIAGLRRLSEPERTVIVLKHIHGFQYDEISAMTGMPEGTLKSHACRGRRKLAALLQTEPMEAQ